MRVLLVQPSSGDHLGFRHIALNEPLGLESVAACLKDHDVQIADLRLEKNFSSRLREFRPHAVGVNASFSTDIYNALDILRAAKEESPNTLTFAGGHHASLSPVDLFDRATDAIVIGEGEITTPELLDAWEGGSDLSRVEGIAYTDNEQFRLTPARRLMNDLDLTPLPARELTARHRNKYFYKGFRPVSGVETARGCPYRCKFCSVWYFYNGKYRVRSPERVLRDIEATSSRDIIFTDDNFLQNVRRAESIYELVRETGIKKRFAFQARSDTIAAHPEIIEKWKRIGLNWVLIGFESITDEELQKFNKHNTMETNEKAVEILHKYKIGIQAAFIVDPVYTEDQFQKLINYVKRMRLRTCQFTVLTPLPGTQFFKEKWDELTTRNYELYDFLHAVLPTKLPLNEFYRNFCKLYRSTLLSAGSVAKAALSLPFSYSFSDLKQVRALRDLLNPKSYLKGHITLKHTAEDQKPLR